MKKQLENRIICPKRRITIWGVILLSLWLLNSCLPTQIFIPPLPSKIESIEGYGSLKIEGEEGVSKMRFSFLFSLPHKGRIESFDILGRSLYFIIIDRETSFFVLPSKKVYWQGDVEEIIMKSIGFRLNQYEMTSLLQGRWKKESEDFEAKGNLGPWHFTRDEKGRIAAGRREEFRFEIKEFFSDSSLARVILFNNPWSKGNLKILTLNFNQPLKPDAFSSRFLKDYKPKTWAEIEELIQNES